MTIGPPRWCERYIGIRWIEHGAGPDGCHCWGLNRYAYATERGIALPAFDGISSSDQAAIAGEMGEGCKRQPWSPVEGEWRALDVVLMRGDRRFTPRELWDQPTHCGFAASARHVIHVERVTDSICVDVIRVPLFARRILGVFRHRELS